MTTSADVSIPEQKTGYDADDLDILEGLDAVRKRPGMYIHATDGRGLRHLVQEVVDNSTDEAIGKFADSIVITFYKDESVEIVDNGRGIPTGINRKKNMSGVELVFMELHAGGKFGGSGYNVAGGLHGVGASVTNALSDKLQVTVKREGKIHEVTFHKGVPGTFDAKGKFAPKAGLRITGKCPKEETGTSVRFWFDKEIFIPGTVHDPEWVRERARQTAFLVPGLKIVVVDHTVEGDAPQTDEFFFEGGMKDFVDYFAQDLPVTDTLLVKDTGTYSEKVPVRSTETGEMVLTDVARSMEVEVALRWGVGYEPGDVRSFVNIVTTPKGGTHVSGFEAALTKVVDEALKSFKLMTAKDEAVIKADILEGMSAVVLVRIAEPQFEGQTKEILGTSAARQIVQRVVSEHLKAFFANPKNKDQARRVLEKFKSAAATRKDALITKQTRQRKNALETSSMPAKLADCLSDDMEKSELFIVEGDSAMGTAKAARDAEFQALMPIRGKILNTLRANEKMMLDNKECAAIITAIGAGSGRSFDIDKIRYGKLILLADADVDGAHIRTLLLTLCWRYMRPLLAAGRVYSAVPPLHQIKEAGAGGKTYYTYTQEEMEETVAKILKSGKTIKATQRYKGLGEMDEDQLAETTLEVEHRRLRRIVMEDAEEAEATFQMLMAEDVAERKAFITEFGVLLDRDRIDA